MELEVCLKCSSVRWHHDPCAQQGNINRPPYTDTSQRDHFYHTRGNQSYDTEVDHTFNRRNKDISNPDNTGLRQSIRAPLTITQPSEIVNLIACINGGNSLLLWVRRNIFT